MNKEYIDKHEAYLLLKQKAETYMLPATKEAYEKAARLIDSLPTIEVEPVNGWISVKDKLPEDDVSILICSTRKTISKATYSSDMGRYYIADSDLWYNELDITHWQPLPEPPKGE